MKFLVDANVLSEAVKPIPEPKVLAWLSANETELAINPIVLGELQYGILLLPSGKKRDLLRKWLLSGVQYMAMLDWDANTAMEWAHLLAELKTKGRAMPIKDSLIAASARQHRLSIATRNTKDFAHTRVPIINPFD
jgi:predicted nucleic acid-binding protein